jgi:hypothetical protein
MKPIHNPEQLLVHLAGNGDPSAFYTLILPNANAAYVAERNSGKKHAETLTTLLPSFKKMYQTYISRPIQSTFKEWYKEQEKKYLSASQEVSIESLNETGFKNLLTADIVHFDWALNLILQRHYGKFRRAKRRGAAIGPFIFFNQGNWVFKTALITGLIVLFLIGSNVFLTLSKTQFALTFGPAQAIHTVVFPSTTRKFFPANSVSRFNAAAGERPPSEAPLSQSLALHDTIKIHDTVRIVNRSKQSGSGASGLNSGVLVANPQPLSPATPVTKPIEGARPNISSTLSKTNPSTPAIKKPLPDSLR